MDSGSRWFRPAITPVQADVAELATCGKERIEGHEDQSRGLGRPRVRPDGSVFHIVFFLLLFSDFGRLVIRYGAAHGRRHSRSILIG